jgi:hypothetical protein
MEPLPDFSEHGRGEESKVFANLPEIRIFRGLSHCALNLFYVHR